MYDYLLIYPQHQMIHCTVAQMQNYNYTIHIDMFVQELNLQSTKLNMYLSEKFVKIIAMIVRMVTLGRIYPGHSDSEFSISTH